VSTLWPIFRSQCKTRLSSLSRSLFLSRERATQRAQRATDRLHVVCRRLAQAHSVQSKLEADNKALRQRISELQQQASNQPQFQLPSDLSVPGQQFGARMIELSINMASQIGIRPTVRALKILFNWLKLDPRLPSKDTIRCWMQRLGVARMEKTGKLTDAVWLVDETVQIGKEKVLAVLAVDPSRFQRNKKALSQKDLNVLAFRPATSWTSENVAKVYQELSERHGVPRAIVTDGAKNLRDAIATVNCQGKSPLALRDLKHLLANALEAEVAPSKAFQDYANRIHQTISAVQQTELAHFAPPSFNRRSRFMNLQKHLKWFRMILWQWKHKKSGAQKNISPERMREKFSWVAGFECAVRKWEACQRVISACLEFSNGKGIYCGAAQDLRTAVGDLANCRGSQLILDKAVSYLQECEQKLHKAEQLPISTEILESSFGSYKRLERHHSRGGFTTLLPVFATILKPTKAKEICHAFKQVRVKDVHRWVTLNIPSTVTSRKQEAFREARPKKRATLSTSTS
jgi:transposase-like protein